MRKSVDRPISCFVIIPILAMALILGSCSTSTGGTDGDTNAQTGTDSSATTGSGGDSGTTGGTAGTGTTNGTDADGSAGETPGTGGTETPVTTAPTAPVHTVIDKPNLADIVGSWKGTKHFNVVYSSDINGTVTESTGTCDSVDTLAIGSDGSFTRIRNDDYAMTSIASYKESYAEKGTIAMTDGRWTKTVTASFFDDDSLTTDAASIVWDQFDHESVTADEIVIVDGSLYEFAYRRVGAGTGIEGTWSRVYLSRNYDETEGDWTDYYVKMELVISGTTLVTNCYQSATGAFGTPASTDSKDITDNGVGTYSITQYNGVNTFLVAENALVFTSNGRKKE